MGEICILAKKDLCNFGVSSTAEVSTQLANWELFGPPNSRVDWDF